MKKVIFHFLLFSFFCSVGSAFAQEKIYKSDQPNIQLQVKALSNGSVELSTLVDGKKHLLDTIEYRKGIGCIGSCDQIAYEHAFAIDPAGKYIFYSTLNGCGYENDGMTIFRADLDGKHITPVLGRCRMLSMDIVKGGERNYLMIHETSSGSGAFSSWLFDIENPGDPLLQVKGNLKLLKDGSFRYCQDPEENPGLCKNVSMKTLLSRGNPLQLLPRYPLKAKTQQDNAIVYVNGGSTNTCQPEYSIEEKKISRKGSEVLVLQKCGNGHYEVSYGKLVGTMKALSLEGFKILKE